VGQVFLAGTPILVVDRYLWQLPNALGRMVLVVSLLSIAIAFLSFIAMMIRTVWATVRWDGKAMPGVDDRSWWYRVPKWAR
jgi:hypothetical protein